LLPRNTELQAGVCDYAGLIPWVRADWKGVPRMVARWRVVARASGRRSQLPSRRQSAHKNRWQGRGDGLTALDGVNAFGTRFVAGQRELRPILTG
jgi:hypothetical protein